MNAKEKICRAPWCDAPIARKEGETCQNFVNRRYCGKSCAARHGNQKRARKFSPAASQ
jgi:hypothetical protein